MNKKLIAIMCILVLAILVTVGVYFYLELNKERKSAESPTLKAQEIQINEPELSINDLKLCSSIDNSFNCEPKQDTVYVRGEDIQIFFNINNLKSVSAGNRQYKIGFAVDRVVFGPDGNKIIGLEPRIIEEERLIQNTDFTQIPIRSELISDASDVAGIYSVKFTVYDKFSNKQKISTINFELS